MSEQDTTTQPKRTEAGPAGALEAALKAASQSLGTLCGGKIEFGETAVAPGSAEAWPANLAAPLMVTRIDVTGEVSGGTFVITQAADAHAMRAFMLGEEPPAETSAELNADELDAYGELCNKRRLGRRVGPARLARMPGLRRGHALARCRRTPPASWPKSATTAWRPRSRPRSRNGKRR